MKNECTDITKISNSSNSCPKKTAQFERESFCHIKILYTTNKSSNLATPHSLLSRLSSCKTRQGAASANSRFVYTTVSSYLTRGSAFQWGCWFISDYGRKKPVKIGDAIDTQRVHHKNEMDTITFTQDSCPIRHSSLQAQTILKYWIWQMNPIENVDRN